MSLLKQLSQAIRKTDEKVQKSLYFRDYNLEVAALRDLLDDAKRRIEFLERLQ